jgi:hypothetical protein
LTIPLFGVTNSVRTAFLPPEPGTDLSASTDSIAILIFLLPSLFVQVYRYMRLSNPVERQQTKWVVYGFLGMGLLLLLFLLGSVLFTTNNVQPLY